MPNPYHDETGRFCSKEEMKSAAERLARSGDMDAAIQLADELQAIEDAKFDSGVSLTNLGNRLSSFFGKRSAAKQPQPPRTVSTAEIFGTEDVPPLPEGQFAVETETGNQLEFQGVSGKYLRGFYRTGGEDEAQLKDMFSAVSDAIELQSLGEEALADAVLAGEAQLYTPEQSRYFHNQELIHSVPDLKGWTPENKTQWNIVTVMLVSTLEQRSSAFANAGIEEDVVLGAMGPLGEDAEALTVGKNLDSPDRDDEGLISNYDEGWLCAFQQAVTSASKTPFEDGNDDDVKRQLRDFVESQRALWNGRLDAHDSDFNAGGAAAFDADNWENLS